MNDHEPPIAAPATPLFPSAVSVLRCSGAGSIELAARLFHPGRRLLGASGNTIHHGELVTAGGDPLDEVMVAVYRAPASYTGEDAVEIFGHGSPAGVRRILAALYAVGFRAAMPGEFTRRAFMNGKLDLTRAEAIDDLVKAQTAEAHKLALSRLGGAIEDALSGIRTELVGIRAGIAVQLDYPEEDTGEVAVEDGRLERCAADLRNLADSYRSGRLFKEGVAVALAGRTNAGKSSLFNALLRHDRSIVSEFPGTTRDYLEATVDIRGIPVRLYDTAGLRPTGEPIEEEGVRRSRVVIAAADLVLYVLDATEGLTGDDRRRLEEIGQRAPVLLLWNKIDVAGRPAPSDAIPVSALTGTGLPELDERIFGAVSPSDTVTRDHLPGAVVDSERQYDLVRRALDSVQRTRESLAAGMPADVLAVDLQDALGAIGEITGEVVTDEILDAMFGSFCVGK